MFRCYSYTINKERINSCPLKLQFLKQFIKILRSVVNMVVVVWLHIYAYRCILRDYFNSCNFSKNEVMRSLMTV